MYQISYASFFGQKSAKDLPKIEISIQMSVWIPVWLWRGGLLKLSLWPKRIFSLA